MARGQRRALPLYKQSGLIELEGADRNCGLAINFAREADQVVTALHFGTQESKRHFEETDAVFPHDYRFEKGDLFCDETPGHGGEIDEALAAKYPTSRPIFRWRALTNGTMWNW